MLFDEMRMLSWMCGKTREDKKRNERIHEYLGIASIRKRFRERQLAWYHYVMKRLPTLPIKRCVDMRISAQFRGERPLKTCITIVMEDLLDLEILSHWEGHIV